jgi:hypothetical protein
MAVMVGAMLGGVRINRHAADRIDLAARIGVVMMVVMIGCWCRMGHYFMVH